MSTQKIKIARSKIEGGIDYKIFLDDGDISGQDREDFLASELNLDQLFNSDCRCTVADHLTIRRKVVKKKITDV